MATANQVKALIQSHSEGDEARFYAIAMQVAATAARSGHGKFAKELRELVDRAKAQRSAIEPVPGPRTVSMVQPRGELAGLLSFSYPRVRLTDMALARNVASRLERVLVEQRNRDRIRAHGLVPMRKLLFVGPPGTGKTMTASALGGELGLALFTIQLHGLITKYLGETAGKLRLVFDAIQSTRGVYLFDEFDALGSQRGAANEVGEIRRVLNSFLQFLEHDASDSLVIAATNHGSMLDRALFRRFDAVIEYELPLPAIALRIMQDRLTILDTTGMDWARAQLAAEGLSHGEIAQACDQAAKDAILNETTKVEEKELVGALEERRRSQATE